MEILAGENAGRRLHHENVVKRIERVGLFQSDETEGTFFVDLAGKETLAFVVLVQQGYGGTILASRCV